MRLAWRELRRRPGRFLVATVILTLVAMLVMFLGGLLDGLIRSSTNAVRVQNGDLIVFSSTAQSSFLRSRIDADTRAAVEAVDGVEAAGGIGLVQLGARVPGNGPRELAATALFGYETAPDGVPEPPGPGEVYADDVLEADGVEVGMELLLGPARSPVTVIALGDDVFQALVVSVDDDADPAEVARAIDEATDGATNTDTITEAIDAIPGVTQQRSTFNQIIGVTIAIAVVVVALFFALLTVERVGLYGVLKAIGAHNRTLFAGLILQAVVVTAIAVVVAGGLALVADAAIPAGSIPLDITWTRILSSAALLFIAAVVGCAFSLRRVLRVDPASAIGTIT